MKKSSISIKAKESLILIVDDAPDNLKLLERLLAKQGYRIHVCQSGLEALQTAPGLKPELILLDIVMPEMDGYEVCRQLRLNSRTREIPIIFLSAMDKTEDIVRGFQLGAADYITKPVNPAELYARIFNHIELKRYKNELNEAAIRIEALIERLTAAEAIFPACDGCEKGRALVAPSWAESIRNILVSCRSLNPEAFRCPNCPKPPSSSA
jgi:PleD family two-component response regulator